MRLRTALLAGLCLAVTSTFPAQADNPAQACANLAATDAPTTNIEKASLVTSREGLPDFCQVEGRIEEKVGFVMRLPAADWNGKFVVAGCGGFCGSLQPDKPGHSNSLNEALRDGYAAIQTDSGHSAPSWETDWALDDPRALELYAGAWMPLAVETGRHIAARYFEQAPRRTYFSGCSNGGRLGLYAAQRYPDLFDGIAAGDGIFDLSGNGGIHGLWLLQTTRDRQGRAVIDQGKIPLLRQHVLERCDALDGVEDGIVSRPGLCEPAPETLQCEDGVDDNCFSATEVTAIQRLYQGATVDGEQLFPGIEPGSEALWPIWIVGTDQEMAWGERAGEGYLRLAYGIPADQPFRPHDYNLAEALDTIRSLAPLVDATDPDLGALEEAGTRLFYYQGLADPLIIPGRAQDYFAQARQVTGEASLDRTTRFVTVPGFGHCWERNGLTADDFDPLEVIDRWVEHGEAPDSVRALQRDDNGEILRSRTLCALPARAVYQGGDTSRAESFTCEAP